jgi:hypothetical protein
MKKLNSIEALEFWEGYYSRDANTAYKPAIEKLIVLDEVMEANSKSIKIRSAAERANS